MDYENNNNSPQQTAENNGSVSAVAENILNRGTEVYGKARQVVGQAYDKTADKVCKTCEKAKVYSIDNPGKTVLIALGIGAGVGFLLGAKSHQSRTSRIAQPMVNALSDIALAFFR